MTRASLRADAGSDAGRFDCAIKQLLPRSRWFDPGRLRLHQTGAIAAPVDTPLLFKIRKQLSRFPIVRTGSSVPRFLYCRYAFKSNRTCRYRRSLRIRAVERAVDFLERAAFGLKPEHPKADNADNVPG